ncbi:ArdC family protein [Kineosporia sp. R_H_3]|uniref:ArdC family protein n=1 Tax=Kineosporia sp. R_H_3 TaxID=1961848 RepID=UPI000B4B1BCD|nr:ArdC family protein [Kineosporia sp. R_H_3]
MSSAAGGAAAGAAADAAGTGTDKLQVLHDRLAEQVAALRSGQDWQRWLATAARFHTYSFGNTMLILAQRPDATAVAGYGAWKALGRQVSKGEKGIAILAPVLRRTPTHGDQPAPVPQGTDRTTGPPETGPARTADPERATPAAGGEGEVQTGRRRVSGFRVTYVFDVSQTSGTPLPEQPAPQLLEGHAPPGLWDALAAQVAAAGYSLERGDCAGANGVTIPATATVRVRDDVDDAQAVKTLAHELAHVLLHAPPPPRTTAATGTTERAVTVGSGAPAGTGRAVPAGSDPGAAPPPAVFACRGGIEVEAESVAYLVMAAHGLDTSTYTFPYVTHWAEGVRDRSPEDVVRATGERVLRAARQILAASTGPAPATGDLDVVGHRVAVAREAAVGLGVGTDGQTVDDEAVPKAHRLPGSRVLLADVRGLGGPPRGPGAEPAPMLARRATAKARRPR